MTDEFRSGFIAIVGRPNTGKSTLLNALVGRKISIVTPKPQTTQHAITGVLTRANAQLVFVDTPGLHTRVRNLLNRAMNRSVTGALAGADLVVFVIESSGWRAGDDFVLQHVAAAKLPCLLVVNKIDLLASKAELLPLLDACARRHDFAEIVPISAGTGENLDVLLELMTRRLPVGEPLYPADASTDRGLEFRIAEVIREKLLLALRDEVPYGLAVQVAEIEERPGLVLADVLIWVDRESHRPIVVGRGGETLKQVGTAARADLESQLERRFHLETHVKVKRNWADSERALQQFGFDGGAAG